MVGGSNEKDLARDLDTVLAKVTPKVLDEPIPTSCKWMWKVDRNWIYPYPVPVVITNWVD